MQAKRTQAIPTLEASTGLAGLALGLLLASIAILQQVTAEIEERVELKPVAEYEWSSKEAFDEARALTWVDLEQDPLRGFLPDRGYLTEIDGPAGSGLRDEGGIGTHGKSLAVLGIDGGSIISSAAELAKAYAPVETAAEAVAFVAALVPCIDRLLTSGDVVARAAVPASGGFWVQVPLRGCGCVYRLSGTVFAVSADGTVDPLATERSARR